MDGLFRWVVLITCRRCSGCRCCVYVIKRSFPLTDLTDPSEGKIVFTTLRRRRIAIAAFAGLALRPFEDLRVQCLRVRPADHMG